MSIVYVLMRNKTINNYSLNKVTLFKLLEIGIFDGNLQVIKR